MLKTLDGLSLFFKSWLPATSPPRSVVLIVHGLAEHSGRYEHVARTLGAAGHTVFAFDLRGHGRSDGKRAYVDNFNQYVDDLERVLQYIRENYAPAATGELPCFILAHSMGTTITLKLLLDRKPDLAGVILTGTAVIAGADISPLLRSLSGVVGALLPRFPALALNSNTVSRDPAVVQAYHADPFVYNEKIPARTGAEMIRVFKYIQKNMHTLKTPMLIMHGSADQLTNPEGSVRLHNDIASTEKKLVMWPGLYHEIMNEPEQDEVLDEIVSWLNQHVSHPVQG